MGRREAPQTYSLRHESSSNSPLVLCNRLYSSAEMFFAGSARARLFLLRTARLPSTTTRITVYYLALYFRFPIALEHAPCPTAIPAPVRLLLR